MTQVLANYTLPTVMNSLQPASTSGLKKVLNAKDSTTPTSGSPSSNSADNSVASTFLSLLSTELQNQDPTDPVDSTAMVGQMISLNQLDQLISINEAITGTAASTVGLSQPAVGNGSSSSTQGASNSSAQPTAPVTSNTLPFDPNTLMPLGFANSAASVDSSSVSPNTSHNNSGGK
jgi:flagellar basal-body rod modification protein FlgD